MSTCHGCGGLIGHDCFNPQECEAIARDKAMRYDMHAFDEAAFHSAENHIAKIEGQLAEAVDILHCVNLWMRGGGDPAMFALTVQPRIARFLEPK